MQGVDIREYGAADRAACASIAGADWVDPGGSFYVAEHDGQVIGCGGFAFDQAGEARLVGPVVAAGFRRMGVGRFLAMYAMRAASRGRTLRTISARPPEESRAFFEKLGFRVASAGDGVVEMVKKLEVCG